MKNISEVEAGTQPEPWEILGDEEHVVLLASLYQYRNRLLAFAETFHCSAEEPPHDLAMLCRQLKDAPDHAFHPELHDLKILVRYQENLRLSIRSYEAFIEFAAICHQLGKPVKRSDMQKWFDLNHELASAVVDKISELISNGVNGILSGELEVGTYH